MKYAVEFDQDSGVRVYPHRSDACLAAPGTWAVTIDAYSRLGPGVRMTPSQAIALAHALLAVAEDVRDLERS